MEDYAPFRAEHVAGGAVRHNPPAQAGITETHDMKNILIAAAIGAASLGANAGTLFTMPNDGGGEVQLTDSRVPDKVSEPLCKGRYIAKTWGPRAADVWGCWMADSSSGTVVVRWLIDGGTDRTYRTHDFQPTPYFKQRYSGK